MFSQDFTVFGGALGEVFAEKIHKVMDLAAIGRRARHRPQRRRRRPHPGGRGLPRPVRRIFLRNVQASGVIPQISVIMGPCAGGAVYSPAMTDFIFMVRETLVHVHHRPRRGEDGHRRGRHLEELGGAMTHATKSGVAHFVAADEKACLDEVRYLLSFLPSNNLEEPPCFAPTDDPPSAAARAHRPDAGQLQPALRHEEGHRRGRRRRRLLRVLPHWAQNIVCGFARLDGHPVGIVGNQPQVLAGVLDIDCSEKAARFVRTCDAFNIPLVTFVDVPGFLPGTDQEYGGIIRHGAKLLYAYCEATVPRIQIITRKAYGGAYVVMNSKSIGADLAFAWPSAELAVMGPAGAVEILYRRELAEADDPVARKAELVEEYTERYANPYDAAERGLRRRRDRPGRHPQVLINGLDLLRSKREELPKRKHGNVPL